MADSSLVITIAQTDPLNANGRTGRELLKRIINHLEGIRGGVKRAAAMKVFADGSAAAQASGTVTLSGASGTVGATINGVSITTATAASDTATATNLAAAINASTNALVQYLVTATSALGVVTITAAQPGISGNTITLAASGTGATASGARLTGGTGGNVSASNITL